MNHTVSVFRRASRLSRDGVDRSSLVTPWSLLILPFYIVGIAALFATSLGFFPGTIHGVYLGALSVLLFASGSVFVRLFLMLARPGPPGA